MKRAVAVGTRTARLGSQPEGAVLVYIRGVDAFDLSATDWGLGRRDDGSENEEQNQTIAIDQDFFIPVDAFDSTTLVDKFPKEDDRIRFTFDGVETLYQVRTLDPDPAARWEERYRTHWRIHGEAIADA